VPDLAVTLIKSPIGNRPEARATVRAMGLRRLQQTVYIADSATLRGMISKVSHLLSVQDSSGSAPKATPRATIVVTKGAVSPAEPKPTSRRASDKARSVEKRKAERSALDAAAEQEILASRRTDEETKPVQSPKPASARAKRAVRDGEPETTEKAKAKAKPDPELEPDKGEANATPARVKTTPKPADAEATSESASEPSADPIVGDAAKAEEQ